MARLLILKQSLSTLDDLDFALSDSEEEDEDDEGSMTLNDMLMDGETVWDSNEGLEDDELQDLLADAAPHEIETETKLEKRPKKKRKLSPSAKPVPPVFDLVEPEFQASKSSSVQDSSSFGPTDAYGEAASLQYADAADKSARKKTLRFHTSKIESASGRRQGVRNRAMGGDDDIPYRERRREKEARLAKEAAAKGRGQGGRDLDDAEPEPRLQQLDAKDPREDEQADPDGYYELVEKKAKRRREDKKAEYEAAHTPCVIFIFFFLSKTEGISVRSWTMLGMAPVDLVRSLVLYLRIKVLRLIAQRACAIPESRSVLNSRRQRRNYLPKRLCTRVDWQRLEDMMERGLVYRRLSRALA